MSADTFGKLAAFLVAHVSWRRADKTAYAEFLHVLAHVDADQRVGTVEEILGEFLGKMSLAHACGAEEHERAYWLCGVLQAETIPLDGLHHLGNGIVLPDDSLLEFGLHLQQPYALCLGDALHGNASHHGHHLCHHVGIDSLAVIGKLLFPLFPLCGKFLCQRGGIVAQACSLGEIVAFRGGKLVGIGLGKFGFGFLEFFGYPHMGYPHARTGFVESVDCLVGEITVGYVAVGQLHASLEGGIGVCYTVVRLVLSFYIVENHKSLFGRGRLHHHFLETAFQGAVLLDVYAVFIEGRGSDALYFAACERRLEHVCRIHAALRVACANDSVNLVDEQYHVGILGELGKDGLYTLLEFAAVFRSRHNRGHVEGNHALVEKNPRDLALVYAQGEAFHDSALTHTRLAYEHGVVLLAARKNLCETLYLRFPSHHGVEAAFGGGAGHVVAELVEHRRVGLASRARAAGCGLRPRRVRGPGRGHAVVGDVGIAGSLWNGVGSGIGHGESPETVVVDSCIYIWRHECHLAHLPVVEQREQQVLHIDKRCLEIASLENREFHDERHQAVVESGIAAFGGITFIQRVVECRPKVGKAVGSHHTLHQLGRMCACRREFQQQMCGHDGFVVVTHALVPEVFDKLQGSVGVSVIFHSILLFCTCCAIIVPKKEARIPAR